MDDDDAFEDSAILDFLDALEQSPPTAATAAGNSSKSAAAIDLDYEFVDDGTLELIDAMERQADPSSTAGPSSGKAAYRQTTLFGDVLKPSTQKQQRSSSTAINSSQPTLQFTSKFRKTKKWDQTAFAKSGRRKNPEKGKGNDEKQFYDGSDEEEEAPEEFEQFPAPFVPLGPPAPMKHSVDLLNARRWLFPLNQPKRDYQFNIAKKALFENTLVSLPTGLGKTFIAGVVMLNYYHWFPTGKIVFVAPTKPLVAQQIEACHLTCGIPGSDAIELTGEITAAKRAQLWLEKRVFYMTAQTLGNDLRNDEIDAGDIVLLVVDEAHGATGDSSYSQAVRLLMCRNPHFRLLALTATPGGEPEDVQRVVNSLHISHIEFRSEDSIDLRQYHKQKTKVEHLIEMSPEIIELRTPLAKIMEGIYKPLNSLKIIQAKENDMCKLHPYVCSKAAQRRGLPPWAYSSLNNLRHLAQCMRYLTEYSLQICYDTLVGIRAPDEDEDGGKKKKKKPPATAKYKTQQAYKDLIKEFDKQRSRGLSLHPKMEKLKTLLVNHFITAQIDEEDREGAGDRLPGGSTRAMVFVSFRSAVEEIVDFLEVDQPLIRAAKFIGQGTDKGGKRGVSQKDQLELIKRFKSGELNVLVCTSIGEEGLDIGEVDLIICYDVSKAPIRMLQRAGRTGRKRDGRIDVLIAEGREEDNLQTAMHKYKAVQDFIARGGPEVYGDVERLLPDDVQPQCTEIVMEIEPYVRKLKRKKKGDDDGEDDGEAGPKPKKKRRNAAVDRNIPDGATNGFVTASKLVSKTGSKRKKAVDDDESGDGPPKRAKSAAAKKPAAARKSGSAKGKAKAIPDVIDLDEDDDDTFPVTIGDFITAAALKKPAKKKKTERNSLPPKDTPPVATDSWLLDDGSDVEVIHGPSPRKPIQLDSDSDIEIVQVVTPAKPLKSSVNPAIALNDSPMWKNPLVIQSPPVPSAGRMGMVAESPTSLGSPVLSQHRLHQFNAMPTSSPALTPEPRRRVRKDPVRRADKNQYIDAEAVHSGEEHAGDTSDSDAEESESDRQFVSELPPTQANPSYDQSVAYRASLMTQAPGRGRAPHFAHRPVRQHSHLNERERFKRAAGVESSDPVEPAQASQYDFDDGFLVADDDTLLLEGSSEL